MLTLKKAFNPKQIFWKSLVVQFKKNILGVFFGGKEEGGDKEPVFQLVETFKIDVILDNLGQQNFWNLEVLSWWENLFESSRRCVWVV